MTPRHTEWLTFNVICDDVLKSKSPTIAYTEFMTSNGGSFEFLVNSTPLRSMRWI